MHVKSQPLKRELTTPEAFSLDFSSYYFRNPSDLKWGDLTCFRPEVNLIQCPAWQWLYHMLHEAFLEFSFPSMQLNRVLKRDKPLKRDKHISVILSWTFYWENVFVFQTEGYSIILLEVLVSVWHLVRDCLLILIKCTGQFISHVIAMIQVSDISGVFFMLCHSLGHVHWLSSKPITSYSYVLKNFPSLYCNGSLLCWVHYSFLSLNMK